MKLPEFIYSATISNNTSLGRNKAFPPKEDLPYEYYLMKERFNDVVKSVKNIFGYVPSVVEAEKLLNRFINQTMKIERPLRHQLEELCESVVNAVLSVPEETVLFSCELVDNIEPNKELRILPEDEKGEPTYTFNDVKEITRANDAILKRRMVDSLVQGVAYSLMSQALDTDPIRDWSPELMPLYEKVIVLNDYLLFTKQEKITDKNPMLGAYVETDLGKGDEKTVISAQGLIYPLLLQESFRGFFELFASHGLPNDTKHALYIIRRADFIMAEAWDLRMGQALWNHISSNIGEVEYSVLPYLFSSIVQLSQDEFNETMQNILIGTKKGKSYIQDIVAAIEHDMEYQQFKKDINNIELDKTLIADDDVENNKMIEEEETNNKFVHSDNFNSWFRGSHVVNSDGTPKLMYRGDDNEITTFDRKYSASSNLYGTGFYFTDSKSHATHHGNAQAYYLKITHPLSTEGHEITKQQLYKFLVAVDENEDYGLYNYGYGANPKTVLNSVWGKSDFAMLLDINACCIGDLVEATLLFNQLNGTDFDGFILDTETVVFDNSQIRKANITEQKQYITEGKVDKQAEKRCYDVIKQGNSWLQPVMDNPCQETDAKEGMTNFQYEYKGIRDHWVRNNVKFTPVVMNILYNQLGYRGTSPKVDEIDNFKKILTLINANQRYASMPWNEAINYSYEDWYNIFKVVMENEERMEDAEINNLQHSGNDYEIIKVNTCEESSKYGNYSGGDGSKLCYTQSQSTWDNYTNNGQYSCYVCLKNGWKSIKPIPGEDSPMDEYGLSMIFVFVNQNGKLTTSNTRWNHEHVYEYNQKHGTNKTVDKFLSRLEISKIVGVNFMETFKGKNSVSFEEATQKILSLDDWFEISQYCDSYLVMENNQMIIEINGKYNLLDFKNKKFHFNEWCDLIVYKGSSYILCYTRGQNFVYNINEKQVVLQNSPYSIVHVINNTLFEVKVDDNHENVYNAQTKQLLNNEAYTDVNPWNNFFQVFKGKQSSFINENGEYIINDWFDLVFEPLKNHMDKYVVCKKGDKFNVLSYNQDTIKLLSEEWFDELDYREFFGRVVVDSFPEHGSRYCIVINNDVAYALFTDGYVASFWQACVIGTQKANQIDELGTEIWNYMDSNPRFGDTALDAMKRFYYNEGGYPSLKNVAEDYAYIKLEEKYGNDEDVDNSNVEQELHQLTSDYHLALQKTAIYYFNYNPIEETRTYFKKQLNEYLDKQYMKPLWDYLKAGNKYSSGGNYTPSERLIIPFFEWACNQLNRDEFKQFGKALINCPQLHEKLKAVIRNGHQAIECYSQMTNGLQKVRTRDFLKQNAKRLFTITYNDPDLSLYWDKFYFFINGKEGHQQLKKGQYLDADTVLMNPEIKKPMWLVHFTSNEEDALNICKNGFKYGLEPHQMSRLGYTNKDINREDKKGKFAYAYNAGEITDGFFPSDFILPKEQWRFDNNFDQKVWENAIHYCIMFVAPGIEVRHDTDAQQQVIFNTDTARDYVLLSFSMVNNNVLWNVCSIDGRIMYNNKSLTKVIKWVMSNFNQYKRYICQKH